MAHATKLLHHHASLHPPLQFSLPGWCASAHCAAGDYWPGEAENALAEIQEQQRKEGKNSKKGPRGKAIKGKRYGQVPPPLPSCY